PAVLPPTQWATNDPKLVKWLKDASNLAKQAFLDGLTREFGHEIADVLQMYLPDEGTPLSSRDVKDIIGIGEMYRQAHEQEIDALMDDLDSVPHRLPPPDLEDLSDMIRDEDDPTSNSDKGKEREIDEIGVADPPTQELPLPERVDTLSGQKAYWEDVRKVKIE